MTHEPECGHSHPELYGHLDKCRCDILRAAYQRGREDAAEAVEQLRIGSFGIAFDGKFYESVLDTNKAISAARGDGTE